MKQNRHPCFYLEYLSSTAKTQKHKSGIKTRIRWFQLRTNVFFVLLLLHSLEIFLHFKKLSFTDLCSVPSGNTVNRIKAVLTLVTQKML